MRMDRMTAFVPSSDGGDRPKVRWWTAILGHDPTVLAIGEWDVRERGSFLECHSVMEGCQQAIIEPVGCAFGVFTPGGEVIVCSLFVHRNYFSGENDGLAVWGWSRAEEKLRGMFSVPVKPTAAIEIQDEYEHLMSAWITVGRDIFGKDAFDKVAFPNGDERFRTEVVNGVVNLAQAMVKPGTCVPTLMFGDIKFVPNHGKADTLAYTILAKLLAAMNSGGDPPPMSSQAVARGNGVHDEKTAA